MNKLTVKTSHDIAVMKEGGEKLTKIAKLLREKVQPGVYASDIEREANLLIEKEGAAPSFKMVPGYSWATCINVNSGLVHGIPDEEVLFEKGDKVSVDVGIFYKSFHLDCSFTVGLSGESRMSRFLATGKKALLSAFAACKLGNRIYDISFCIESVIKKAGYTPIVALVGHGIGKALHEEPAIPCVTEGFLFNQSPRIVSGMTLAIEVMYAMGDPSVVKSSDGWTISMRDGRMSALFEETVAVTSHGSLWLTRANL